MNSLIDQIRAGNKQAFKILFEKEYANLVRLSYGYLYDQMASEDIVQESFMFLWENANRIEIKISLEGYLYTLVKNRCLNNLKSLDITRRCDLHEIGIELQKDEISEEPELEGKDANILKAVESLPEKMQKIVRMRFVQNYRYKEIAKELDISVNTVKTQLKRAKIRIEEVILLLTPLLIKFFWL